VGAADYDYFRLADLARQGIGKAGSLPFSIRILLEICCAMKMASAFPRRCGNRRRRRRAGVKEISFMPARVLLQISPASLRGRPGRHARRPGAMGGDPSRPIPCCRPT